MNDWTEAFPPPEVFEKRMNEGKGTTMSESQESELWGQMDEGFQGAVADDAAVVTHARVPREELQRHMAEAHGVSAYSEVLPMPAGQPSRLEWRVVALDAVREATLRAGHWRLHELGSEHRPSESEKVSET